MYLPTFQFFDVEKKNMIEIIYFSRERQELDVKLEIEKFLSPQGKNQCVCLVHFLTLQFWFTCGTYYFF